MTRGVILGLLAAVLVALALRGPEPDRRPMHNDEAVNALKFRSLWEHSFYRYDPNEHHGPTLFYASLAWAKLTRAPDFDRFTEGRLRAVTVLFGVGLILLFPLVVDGLGRSATVWAGLLTAVSPALVYYSRDYIHETVLVFFTFLALGAGWRYYRSRRVGWALLTGTAVGLMHATKETFLLTLAAMAGALILIGLWSRWVEAGNGRERPGFKTGHLLVAVAAWVVVATVLFSSFFTNADGPLASLRTYAPWLRRAAGESPHLHPWNFYLGRLTFFHVGHGPVWTEALILGLALVGLGVALTRKGPRDAHPGFLRFIALYTVILTVIYSAIPYKTTWCLLSFWQGSILLAGVGAVALLERTPGRGLRIAAGLLLLAGAGQLAWQAWRAGVTYAADRRNPYVYAQTAPDVLTLADEVHAVAQASPEGHHLLVKVMAPDNDYWPLPWYLRSYDQVGWWSDLPADPFAPVMIVSTRFKTDLEDRGTHVMVGMFELRPDAFFELYVRSNLWREFLEARFQRRDDRP
jgi:uncharacterized protein (TIGR03663 family)